MTMGAFSQMLYSTSAPPVHACMRWVMLPIRLDLPFISYLPPCQF